MGLTPHLARLFWRHVVRDVRRHPLLALLNLASVALGIAVYLAIQIANHSANRSFTATVDVVAGKSHLEIRGDIPDETVPLVSGHPAVEASTPTVEGVVTLPDFPNEYLRVLGLDVFTNAPFRTFELQGSSADFDFQQWLAEPYGMGLAKAFAQSHGLRSGDNLRVLVNSVVRDVRILFLIDLADSPAAANPRLAVMDLGWAQELFSMSGKLSSIQILLKQPRDGELAMRELQSALPPGLTVAPPAQRSLQIGKMLGAFELNLTALSMVSMLVGIFLIYNTISASVVRRRSEIGILRSLGTTRHEVRALFLGEALLFGVLGIALGMIAGVALARVLVGSVAETISSLYVLLSIDRSFFSAWQFASAAAFGIVSVLAAAWLPANEAARVEPLEALSLGARMQASREAAPSWLAYGVFALAAAAVCSWIALRTSIAGFSFVAAFFVLLGFSAFAPPMTRWFAGIAKSLAGARVIARLGAENLRRSIHRNGITVAALGAAIAMMTGVSVMTFSFRETVDAWVERGMVADLFIAPASNETVGLDAFIPPEAISFLEKQPGVAAVDTFREISTTMNGQVVSVAAIKGADRRNLRFVGGHEREKMERFFRGDGAIVTESFARKFHLRDGDALALETPRGQASLAIAGVYYDYTRDRGIIALDRGTFDKWWGDPRVQSLALYLVPGADPEPVAAAFRGQFGANGEFSIYSNCTLRERILAVFDQTFAVTYLLRAISVIVAIIAIFLSVTALVFERQRDIGVLRAIGAARAQVRTLFLFEAGLIGAIASVLGLAGGACLALVLTLVVNKAFFGWTIALEWPWPFLLTTPIWIIAAAALAAWWPASQAARARIANAIRSE